MLIVDISCIQCSYNLRGLYVDKTCPECGRPIAHSARSDLLQYSSPDWLKNLTSGASFIGAAIGVQFILTICMFAIRGLELIIIVGLVQTGVVSIGALGFWRFTHPEPNSNDPAKALRRWTRFTLTGGMSLAAATLMAFVLLVLVFLIAGSCRTTLFA